MGLIFLYKIPFNQNHFRQAKKANYFKSVNDVNLSRNCVIPFTRGRLIFTSVKY